MRPVPLRHGFNGLELLVCLQDCGSLLILLYADMTAGVLCRLVDVIHTETELLDLHLGVESMQVIPRRPHRVSQDCFLAEPTHPRSREPPADSPRQLAVHSSVGHHAL